jgi:5'-methylthioadenosine phosphorylase
MTNVTEAKLAREAGICYATLALVTDYDCWLVEEEPVTLEAVLQIMGENVEKAQNAIKTLVTELADEPGCACGSAASTAIVTDKKLIPEKLRKELSILFEI